MRNDIILAALEGIAEDQWSNVTLNTWDPDEPMCLIGHLLHYFDYKVDPKDTNEVQKAYKVAAQLVECQDASQLWRLNDTCSSLEELRSKLR